MSRRKKRLCGLHVCTFVKRECVMQPLLFDSTSMNEPSEIANFSIGILESSTEYSIIATDLKGVILLWNEGARRIYGYEPTEVLNKMNAQDLCAPDEPLACDFIKILDLLQETRKWEGLVHRIRKNGERFMARLVITPHSNQEGEIIGFLLVSKDLSKEHLIAELKAEQIYTRSLIEANVDALLAIDRTGNIIDVNRQMCEITGYHDQELIGSVPSLYVTEPERMEELIRLTQVHERVTDYELTICSREGKLTEVSCSALIVYKGDTNDFLGILVVVRDITQQKFLEQQLQEKHQELQEQYRLLQKADRLKSEFLANMSHELRTPLNSIIGFCEMLYEELVGPISAKQKSCLNEVLNSSQHLLRLINDVLDLAKVESGKMVFEPEPVELKQLIEDVQAILHPLITKKYLHVDLEVDSSVSGVVIDPAKFKQVLYNYLSNAIKFTPENGKISVRILPETPTFFRLEVEDTGIGIGAEDVERLFIAFQQLDSSPSKQFQGTGLGLALTKHLIEVQGGYVGVRSVSGVGSTFFAVLPMVIEKTSTEENEQTFSLPAPIPGRPELLIVEDEHKELEQLAKCSLDAGYNVDSARRGTQALEKCQTKKFDVIALDLILPDIDGWDLLRTIRAKGPNTDTPVIIVTMVKEKGTGIGFDIEAIFTKPIQCAEILEILKRLKKEKLVSPSRIQEKP
jgi:PAS domain S-box-containing protein